MPVIDTFEVKAVTRPALVVVLTVELAAETLEVPLANVRVTTALAL
jgi:hypothetical protein